jgi:cytoskeletal protein CcmA (bactofilin family)
MSAAPLPGVESPACKAIGRNVIVKGQIQSREDLVIEGQVEGTIEMSEHQLTVAASGILHANVNARDVEVRGTLEGKVEAADKVFIRKGAKFVGDIRSAGIVIEDGAYIKGTVDLSRQPAPKRQGPDQSRPNLQIVAS